MLARARHILAEVDELVTEATSGHTRLRVGHAWSAFGRVIVFGPLAAAMTAAPVSPPPQLEGKEAQLGSPVQAVAHAADLARGGAMRARDRARQKGPAMDLRHRRALPRQLVVAPGAATPPTARHHLPASQEPLTHESLQGGVDGPLA